MASSNVNHHKDYFERANLTPIRCEPTFESLPKLRNEIKANTISVYSHIGGGAPRPYRSRPNSGTICPHQTDRIQTSATSWSLDHPGSYHRRDEHHHTRHACKICARPPIIPRSLFRAHPASYIHS